ncbi:MAG: c-type cytochrome domain-containing protein [Bacteroidota bacterium]
MLVFFLVFESKLQIPGWLQVAGRMHPLLLHFPIVLLIMYALMIIYEKLFLRTKPAFTHFTDSILLIAALTAAITAIAGLLLSKEGGYDAQALEGHKWFGVAVSFIGLGWYYFRNALHSNKLVAVVNSCIALLIVTIAGHKGANITHGENFLTAPLSPASNKQTPQVPIEQAVVYSDVIFPILKAKCMGCHNSSKAKGELIMETQALLLKGGKSGALWDPQEADLGLMLRRLHLPIDEKKHMPPKGKPQLTEEEIAIITQWIKKGSDFSLKLSSLPGTDTLYQLAAPLFATVETNTYDFETASQSTIEKLNTGNRVVSKEAINSPALHVSFFNAALFDKKQLDELTAIKKQIVSLNLAKMPVTDEDLKTISGFENLHTLNLSFTQITGSTLAELKKLKFLESLSLSGTATTSAQLSQLKDFPKLKSVYAWKTKATPSDITAVQKQIAGIRFETGYTGSDTIVLQLSPPVFLNAEGVVTEAVSLRLKHYIQGTTIRYTTDGTEPDSIHSKEFKQADMVNDNVFIRAKAFKKGWTSSLIAEASFFKNTYTPDSVLFILPPDSSYSNKGSLLIDRIRGDLNFRSGTWLAWRQTAMEVMLVFNKPVPVKNITLSVLKATGSYIFPPQQIEVWGGASKNSLRLIGKTTPAQLTAMEPISIKGYGCDINSTPVNCIKLKVTPIPRLPSWHPGKGQKAWIFVDEILLN